VNPIATILAAMMMADWLGEQPTAQAIHQAVAQVVAEGRVRTYDMGGSASTLDMAHAVAGILSATRPAAKS
jgi:3-isopropylmalate dehydrogenase